MSNNITKDQSSRHKKIFGKGLKENVELKDYTTMQVGGVADYLYKAKSIDDLIKAMLAAKKLDMPYFVLGGGSNVIVSDYGFAGLVIINQTSNISFLSDKAQIIVDSGVSLGRLVMESAGHGLSGLEPLVGIPGTVGGAIYGNAGAYRVQLNNFIKSITLLSPDGKIVRYKGEWLKSGYRTTRLKQLKRSGKEIPVILSIKFQLATNKKDEIMRKIQYFQNLRNQKVPYDKPSSGCIFKNPARMPNWKSATEDPKMSSAGFLLEQIGSKKMHIGGAAVSKKHANFVINNKNASASDIRKLIEELRSKIQEKYDIFLEEEVEYVGQWN